MQIKQFTCFKQRSHLHLSGKPLKLVDQFSYLASNISSTESDINFCIGKEWTALDHTEI